MPGEVTVPALGESLLEATVGEWLKAEGETVAVGDRLVELETEKVAVEVAAEEPGVLEQIVHREGDTVHVGDVLARLTDGARARAETAAPATAPPRETPSERASTEAAAPAPVESSELGVESPAKAVQSDLSTRDAFKPSLPEPAGAAMDRSPAAPSARRLASGEGVDLAQVTGSGPRGRITRQDVAEQAPGIKGQAPAPHGGPPAPAAAGQ